ncbi:MAG: hypothetical protein H7X83_00935 [Verrucomicrobia bacterium]|nr:hypothetical protein [Deltaproteobacteria bacterium]
MVNQQPKTLSQEHENKKFILLPPPRPKGSIALTKMAHIRAELGKVYREARTGKLDLSDATKLTFMLQVLGKVIEGGELEARIEALENTIGGKGNG